MLYLASNLKKIKMFQLIINPAPAILAIATMFGVLVHDMKIDHLASIALPVSFSAFVAHDAFSKFQDAHIHGETRSVAQNVSQLSSEQPRAQTRGTEDKKYVTQKKFSCDIFGEEYSWPSV